MIIGWVCGTGRFGDNSLSRELIHKIHKHFVKEYGSVICSKIRERADGKCPQMVAKAAKRTAEVLVEQFTNYEKK